MGLKALRFGNINSLDYGVGITGEGVYSAPERDVEIINIQGRNGDYILDNGRFNNIEVVYHAVMGDVTQPRFAKKLSDFRNALLSQVGYQRLEDDYNPDEYRMGVCVGGIAISPAQNSMGAEFDLRFNCKPQRFLKAGELAVTVATGGKLYNPTPFGAKPILEIEGYGNIYINGEEMNIADSPMGPITVSQHQASTDTQTITYSPTTFYETDKIQYAGFAWKQTLRMANAQGWDSIQRATITSQDDGLRDVSITQSGENTVTVEATYVINRADDVAVNAGRIQKNVDIQVKYDVDGYEQTGSGQLQFVVRLESTEARQLQPILADASRVSLTTARELNASAIRIDSTYSALGNPLYFDLDTGEAYKYENGVMVSVNNAVWLGVSLPELKQGENVITYGENIHDLKVVPRWWLV